MNKWLVLILLVLLNGCVYRLDIQQGNIIAQKDIDRLRAGLTKNQVVYVLGNPVTRDSFGDAVWHYLYTYKHANERKTTVKKLDLFFDGDNLVGVKGDFEIPQSLTPEDALDQPAETAKQPG